MERALFLILEALAAAFTLNTKKYDLLTFAYISMVRWLHTFTFTARSHLPASPLREGRANPGSDDTKEQLLNKSLSGPSADDSLRLSGRSQTIR